METWYLLYASSKKLDMRCLSSAESQPTLLVASECAVITPRDQWSEMCEAQEKQSPCAPTIRHLFVSWRAKEQVDELVKRNASVDCLPKIMTL